MNCNNSHTGQGPKALTAQLGEGERVTNLLFFFLYFHYHQIWDECYFCKTQQKKKIDNKETGEPKVLKPSTSPLREAVQTPVPPGVTRLHE